MEPWRVWRGKGREGKESGWSVPAESEFLNSTLTNSSGSIDLSSYVFVYQLRPSAVQELIIRIKAAKLLL